MTDEELEKMLSFVKLSENLTDATNRNIDEIAELVYMKFEVNLEDYDFASQFDALEKEVTDAIKEIKTKYGGSPFLTETIRNAMASDNELYLYVENTVKTKKLVGQIKEDYDFDDENLEFASKIGELIYRIICLRARKDIIPLIHRGAYSEDIKNALIFWRNNENSEIGKIESTWQQEFTDRKAILERVLGGRITMLRPQAHVGSEGLDGKGDKIADYMFHHGDTRNVTLVEIKTPVTQLLGKAYRNTYSLSNELSGTVAQVLTQRVELTKNFFMKAYSSKTPFEVSAPKCYIIVGNIKAELGSDEQKIRAFEMHRQALSASVTVITFDELYDLFSKFNLVA